MAFFSKMKFWKKGPAEAPEAPREAGEAPRAPERVEHKAPEVEASGKGELAPWQTELLLNLRQAEPRLSVWLSLVLRGVDRASDELWERLRFLFKSLETPDAEATEFIERFRKWLANMDYERVEEFRSELQYRLALALGLEDEEDERNRLMLKLSDGLAKTRETITRRIDGLLQSHATMDQGFWDELEEILVMADIGFETAAKLLDNLKSRAREAGVTDPSGFKQIMGDELAEVFRQEKRITAVNPPEVVLVIGVNGVGKTTTIAKLAYRAQLQGRKVLVVAGDTFRAAAVEQLGIWAKRVGAGFHAKEKGADPAAVAFEAMDKALREGYDLVLVDTAGRLHTKVDLMDELGKVKKVLGKKHPGAPHRNILVLDATTGQNAISQARLFNEAVGVDEIVLTKLDGTAKGGVLVSIAMLFRIPITFVGLGEKMEDLRPFDGRDFAQALLGIGGPEAGA